MSLELILVCACAVFGACVGSFLNVVIYRLPRGLFRSMGRRSACPSCAASIRWYDNLPVLSWLVLGGRARCCATSISIRYPAVELLTALLFVWLFAAAPFPLVGVEPKYPDSTLTEEVLLVYPGVVAFLFQATFVALLVASAFIDLDHRILPDVLDKPGMVIGVVGCALVPGLSGRLEIAALTPWIDSTLHSLTGLLTGVLLTLGIRTGARQVFQKEAMGLGDVKFMGMIGAFVGWEGALLTFFLACLFGALGGLVHRWVTGDSYIPFGPFLAMGALPCLLHREQILGFLLVTWPEWQQQSPAAPWVLLVFAVVCVVFLVVLVRRGRGS